MSQIIDDQVPPQGTASNEIGFSLPERYNASRVLFDNLVKGNGGRMAATGPGGTLTYESRYK